MPGRRTGFRSRTTRSGRNGRKPAGAARCRAPAGSPVWRRSRPSRRRGSARAHRSATPAVIAMTGVRGPRPRCGVAPPSRRSRPSLASRQSISTAANGARASAASASIPFPATSVVNPRCSRIPTATSWLTWLSSTTSTCPRPLPLLGYGDRGACASGTTLARGPGARGAAATAALAWSAAQRCPRRVRPQRSHPPPRSATRARTPASRESAEIRCGQFQPVHSRHAQVQQRQVVRRAARRRLLEAAQRRERRPLPARGRIPHAVSCSVRITRFVWLSSTISARSPTEASAEGGSACASPWGHGRRQPERQREPEGAAPADLAVHPDARRPWPSPADDRSSGRDRCRRTGVWSRSRLGRTARTDAPGQCPRARCRCR